MISTKQIDSCASDRSTADVAILTSAEIMEVFEKLQDGGQTIVLITHERDIAAHASRQIHLLDGLIEQDVITERVA